MKVTVRMLWVFLATSFSIHAQELIPLDEADLSRLAIEFVSVVEVNRQSGNEFPATVISSPESVAAITAPYGGVVESWRVAPGVKVQAGDVLAHIRSEAILELQGQWLTAASQLQEAQAIRARDEGLFDQGIISAQRTQQSNRGYEQARIALNALTGKLARAGFTDADLLSLQDGVALSGLYMLRTPVAGVVSHRAFSVGEPVGEYGQIATVQGAARPWLSIHVPARLAGSMSVGHELILAGNGEDLTMRQKDLVVDETTQTVEILAEFNSPAGYMPGQVLNVIIAPANGGVLIPSSAVVHSGDETTVYVAVTQGVEARNLDLQPAGDNYIASSGVRIGERVVIQGASVLKGIQLGLGSDE